MPHSAASCCAAPRRNEVWMSSLPCPRSPSTVANDVDTRPHVDAVCNAAAPHPPYRLLELEPSCSESMPPA
uniref:Uncharacterized protein n=1 Tax=Oryza glumipatula TaxID=40148 RepID=A0A0E0A9K2_9ORYZ